MEKQQYFNILTRNRNIKKCVKCKCILQRLYLASMLILSVIFLFAIIEGIYWHVVLKINRTRTFNFIFVILWIFSAIGYLLCDIYNPIRKIVGDKNDYNTQCFILIEVISNELRSNSKITPYLLELFQFLYKYVGKMKYCKDSLYVFGNDEIGTHIDNLYEIVAKKIYFLFKRNKPDLIKLFEALSETYMNKINNLNSVDKFKEVVNLINLNNSIDCSAEPKLSWRHKLNNIDKYKKCLIYIVSACIVAGVLSTILFLQYPQNKITICLNAVIASFSLPVTIALSFLAPEIIERWKK